jgi:hypothetical protein
MKWFVVEMEVQYVYDEDGRQTGVIVPIHIWNKISHLVGGGQKEKSEWDPSKYRGMYRDQKIDAKKESAALRDEWTRE